MRKRYTTDFIKEEIKKLNPKLKLLNEYKTSKSKLKFLCECGEVFEKNWTKIKESPRCKKCGYKAGSKKLSLNIKQLNEKLEKMNFVFISGDYKNAYSDIEVMCIVHNNTFHTKYSKLLKGYGCVECAKESFYQKRSLDIHKITTDLKRINPTLKILDKTYKNNKAKINVECEVCGYKFQSNWSKLKIGRGCKQCAYKKRIGAGNPSYNPNLTDEERSMRRLYLRGESMIKFREGVFKRDNYTCQICKKRGNKLNAHHLNGYHWFLEGRYDVNNGVTLCENCHKKFHDKYGKKDNTLKQFMEFKKIAQ